MRISAFLAAIIVTASLSSCALTKSEYEEMHTVMQGSPALKRDAIRKCIASHFSADLTDYYSKLMNVSKSDVPSAFCNRLHGAIASGRLKYEDVRAIYNNSMSPNLVRIMQGR
jgi:hypothetical protein